MSYFLHLIVLLEIYLMLSLSLNLMVGYTGLLTMAHAAFYGIGAYVTALLVVDAGLNFTLAIAAAASSAVVLSYLISSASLKFHGDYFILATLAFQVLTLTVLYNWVDVTRGPFGIARIPKPSLFGFSVDSPGAFALLASFVVAAVVAFLVLLFRSPFGRTLRAIRDDELAATMLGKSVISYKRRSVAISSATAAVAGALYALYTTFIDPSSFNTEESILMLSMVIVGGTGNVKGPVVGTAILIVVPEVLRFLPLPALAAAHMRLVIYGLLLILVMRLRPQGIAGEYRFE